MNHKPTKDKGNRMMDKFTQLLKESVIVQSILTVMMWAVVLYMYTRQLPIPVDLAAAAFTVLGFYFGSKSQNAINRIR